MNTHYAVVTFGGDPAGEHPDEELRGEEPRMTFIACGREAFCWEHLAHWTEAHPLRMWEEAEVLARDVGLVAARAAVAVASSREEPNDV